MGGLSGLLVGGLGLAGSGAITSAQTSPPLNDQDHEFPHPLPADLEEQPEPGFNRTNEPALDPTSVCDLNTAVSLTTLAADIPASPPGELDTIPGPIAIAGFRFSGNSAITTETLQAYLDQPLGDQQYTFDSLLAVAQDVTQALNEDGYVNSYVTIPPQVVGEDGVVILMVVEGGLERIQLRRTNARRRLNDGYLCDRLALAAQPLNINELLDVLRQLQLNPLIDQINAELIPGSALHRNILTVELKEAKSLTVQASFDNARPPSVGTQRQQVQVSEGNLLGMGDRLTAIFSATAGSTSLEGRYTLPLNAHDGQLTLSIGQGESTVIEEPFDYLDLQGDSNHWGLTWRQPLDRSAAHEVAVDLSLGHRFSQTSILGFNFPLSEGADSDGRIRVTRLQLGQDWMQRGDRSYLGLRSQFTLGLDWFAATRNDTDPDSQFFHWYGQGTWLQRFRNESQLLVQGGLQWSDRPLLAQEQFSLGGLGTVRGYRQDVVSRDNGAALSLEYQQPLIGAINKPGGKLWLAPFIDWGIAWQDEGRDEQAWQTLVSLGLGLVWQVRADLSARLYWGLPLIEVDRRDNTLQENGLHFFIQSEIAF
ncbi:ShlB/FhaC/HecB family hemolysin secretion/activation protein [Spirulina major CS-329]|uniref:ShlB/FhaC/HecB family hemolysin secretion/activation protein n=1 Tax=Spirulina major TaxID=270636 RepID=UPI00232AABDA|nr:ShlB/FhaC/HecB family hemolysin secretion/activation protein [Spirulina major]MDB9501643.1 ShlB/FhaC/HecB family hemolysin secretion/activation protein [Spirulina major CS-329]